MKKFLYVFAALVVLLLILLIRANSAYEDVQVEPAADLPDVTLDEEAIVDRFAGAIRFPTISHDDRSNFDAEAFIAYRDYLETSYPLVHEYAEKTIINDFSLVYHIAGSDPSLKPVLFMGHMDVVPVDDVTMSQWTHPPFDGVVEDGVIWGRGAVDNKLSVMSFLEATEALLRDGHQPARSLYLSFGHDEEVGGVDGALQVANHFAEQGIEFEFVVDEGGAITEGMLSYVDRPAAIIGIGEKGYLNLKLTVNAPGGHSSQPPAQTGLGILSRAIVKVEDNPFPAKLDFLHTTFDAVAPYAPFHYRLAMANTWLLGPVIKAGLLKDKSAAATMRTTTAATMASGSSKSNILPTRAEAVINFRIIPGETAESVRDRVVEIINDERVEVSIETAINPAAISPTDSTGYELLASTIRGFDDNILVAPYIVQGGTDARYFHQVSDNVYRFIMVRISPNAVRQIHGIDEQISVEDYLMAIRFYYTFIQRATG
jgi:carboxypeptidase PM20D1